MCVRILAPGIALGLVLVAIPAGAVNLQSYARVNLVPYAEAILLESSLSAAPGSDTDDHYRLALAGPADCRVHWSVGALETGAGWSELPVARTGPTTALHDAVGNLRVDLSTGSLAHAFDAAPECESASPLRLLITVEYE